MQNALHIGTLGKPHGIKGAISVFSKTQPLDLIFTQNLYLEDGRPFEVSKYENHHNKIVAFSPLIPDRTEAEKWVKIPLYCGQDGFFDQYPDQIFDKLCQGYTVVDKKNNHIGVLEEITTMSDIPMMVIINNTQRLHLGLKIKSLRHENKIIQLEYTLHDH